MKKLIQAPPLSISQWFNTETPITLEALSGKVVVIEAFQMLCPGCVSHGIPQAKSIRETFSEKDVAVIGIHTVFEHHAAMTPISLEAFLYEYRINFPVGVDQEMGNGMPKTMSDYQLQGTPSLILIDKNGLLVNKYFGHISDLMLGSEIRNLIESSFIE